MDSIIKKKISKERTKEKTEKKHKWAIEGSGTEGPRRKTRRTVEMISLADREMITEKVWSSDQWEFSV